MSLEWVRPAAAAAAGGPLLTFATFPLQEPTSLPSSSGARHDGAFAAQKPLLADRMERQRQEEINISRILRAIERPPDQSQQLNEGRRPSQAAAPQEEYFNHLLYPDSEEPPPPARQPPVSQPHLRPPIDYLPQATDYHRPNYQLGRPNKNLKPIHVSISQQTVNGLLSLLLLSVISIYGCMGTIFIMSALTVVESLQTRGNCYLVSLAMAHLLVTLLVIPSSALQIMAGDTLNGQRVCHYQWLTLEFSLIVSQLSFMLIAADNYLGYNCSEKVVTQVASFVQGQQQQQQQQAAVTNCGRHQLAAIESGGPPEQPPEPPPEPGSGVSPTPTKGANNYQYQTAAQSMQADFMAQTAQVAARLEKSREQQRQHASKLAEARKQSTLIRRLLSNLPRRLAGRTTKTTTTTAKTRARAHHQPRDSQAQPLQPANCPIRRESWHLNSSAADAGGHIAPGARFTANEWPSSGGEANQPGGKSRRLARQFASETGSRLERPGGCVNYRNCCGRVTVLFWIACVWASALVYVLYQHELSFGARFCSTSGSNSYQWASTPATSSPSPSNGPSRERPKVAQPQPGKISAISSLPVSAEQADNQPASAQVPAGPSRGGASPLAPAAAAAASNERPAGRREQSTAFNQLAALADGRHAERVSHDEANDEQAQRRAMHEMLYGTVNTGALLRLPATIKSSVAPVADNQSALTQSEGARPVGPQSSNPLEWKAQSRAAGGGAVASALDRAEVARAGLSSEVAAHQANRYEQNHRPNPGRARNWHVQSGEDREAAAAAVDQSRGELLLRNKNDGKTTVILDDVDHADGRRPRQVQVSRARDPDSDHATPSLSLVDSGSRKAATKREEEEEERGRANFIIHSRSMESRNHFGVVGAARPSSTSRAEDDELPSARHFDLREFGRGRTNSSGSGDERAILATTRVERPRRAQQQPGRASGGLDTKPARAPAAAVHLDDDEERRDDGGDDKTHAFIRRAAHTGQAEQRQPELIDGSQRRRPSASDDDALLGPRWRVGSQQQLSESLDVIVADSTGEQLLLWLPVSNDGPQLESQRQLPQKHQQPQTNNNNNDDDPGRGRAFSRFPPHNDDDELSSSSMGRIEPNEFGTGDGAQNKREHQTNDAALASFGGNARLADSAPLPPHSAAQIIMHASGPSNERRARISPAKLIAAVRSGPRDNKHGPRMTTTLNDKLEFGLDGTALASENNEIEGEKSRWLRSLGSPSPCDSCHRNTRQPEEVAGRGRANSSGKQIGASARAATRDRDKFSDGSTNNSADKVGARSQAEARATAAAALEQACDNLNACDKQTIDRDKQQSFSSSSLSFRLGPGEREQPPAPAPGPEERNERGRTLMNNNNNKLERHSTGGELPGLRLKWTNAPPAVGEQRMQISDAPQPGLAAGGANLRRARQVQVATEGGGGTSSESQLNLNPIDYGARPADEAAPRFPPPEQRQTSTANSTSGGSATNQRERRRDYFWHMLLCAVLAPSLLAALLFARAYLQMKEFKMRPYKPMPAAALNSTPPALLTPRSPIPLIAQRQVYAFDLPAGVVVGCGGGGGGGESSGPKLAGQDQGGATDMTLPSNVACIGSPPGFAPAPHEAGGGDSRSCASLEQTDAADSEDEEEDAGECLARAAQETVRRVSEITNEGSSFKRRPLARHAHSVTKEACQSATSVRPPAPPRLSQPTTTTNATLGKRQVNQVMSAPPPQTCLPGVDNTGFSSTFQSGIQSSHYPRPLFNGAPPQINYQQHLGGSAPAQWQRPSFTQHTVASYSAPPSAGFQQLVSYGPGFSVEQQQQVAGPVEQFSNSSRYNRQRHSSPVAYAARTLNSDVSPIIESPHGFAVGQDPHYYQHQNHLNRNQGHAQSFHYGTAAHHYQSYAARQAAAQQQQQDYRTAQQRASLQARGARNRLPLIESSRSSGEAADSATTPAEEHRAPAQNQQDEAMSQALANVIRSVDDQGELTITTSHDKQQQQLSPGSAVVGPASGEPSVGSAASSLKRRLAPKPLELPPARVSQPSKIVSSDQNTTAKNTTTPNTKVILCTYSYMTDDQLLKSNMIVFLVHSACWVPFVALCISAQYRDSFTGELRDLVWWLAVLNCCSCSYLYALTNKDFREAFHKLFFYCFCQSHVTLQRKTPIFRRQLDVDRKGNLRVHIIPGLNVYSSKLFAASGGLRDGLGNDLSAFAASAGTQHGAQIGRPPTQQPPAPGRLTPNGLAPPPPVSIAQGH